MASIMDFTKEEIEMGQKMYSSVYFGTRATHHNKTKEDLRGWFETARKILNGTL